MERLFFLIIIYIILIGPIFLAFSVFSIYRFINQRLKRKSPFSENFLRSPGQSLHDRIEDATVRILSYIMLISMMPALMYSLWITQSYVAQKPFRIPIFLLGLIYLMVAFLIYKLVLAMNEKRKLRLGQEGEIVAGQSLNLLMLEGCHVYHDFQAGKFNIDHIVVGPPGVFAVETKARSRHLSGKKNADHKITYD